MSLYYLLVKNKMHEELSEENSDMSTKAFPKLINMVKYGATWQHSLFGANVMKLYSARSNCFMFYVIV